MAPTQQATKRMAYWTTLSKSPKTESWKQDPQRERCKKFNKINKFPIILRDAHFRSVWWWCWLRVVCKKCMKSISLMSRSSNTPFNHPWSHRLLVQKPPLAPLPPRDYKITEGFYTSLLPCPRPYLKYISRDHSYASVNIHHNTIEYFNCVGGGCGI